jgi:hypothetical protein
MVLPCYRMSTALLWPRSPRTDGSRCHGRYRLPTGPRLLLAQRSNLCNKRGTKPVPVGLISAPSHSKDDQNSPPALCRQHRRSSIHGDLEYHMRSRPIHAKGDGEGNTLKTHSNKRAQKVDTIMINKAKRSLRLMQKPKRSRRRTKEV